jgi:hypothetical protein
MDPDARGGSQQSLDIRTQEGQGTKIALVANYLTVSNQLEARSNFSQAEANSSCFPVTSKKLARQGCRGRCIIKLITGTAVIT